MGTAFKIQTNHASFSRERFSQAITVRGLDQRAWRFRFTSRLNITGLPLHLVYTRLITTSVLYSHCFDWNVNHGTVVRAETHLRNTWNRHTCPVPAYIKVHDKGIIS
jgi:hypothetical protein